MEKKYKVTVRGKTYEVSPKDITFPIVLALINLNSSKVDSVFEELNVKVFLNGQLIFPYERNNPLLRTVNSFRAFLFSWIANIKKRTQSFKGKEETKTQWDGDTSTQTKNSHKHRGGNLE